MTITVFGFSAEDRNKPKVGASIYLDSENKAAFMELIQRGANLWPDAPPAIKEFADMVTVGHVQQNYRAQDTSKNKKLIPDGNPIDPFVTSKH